MEKDLICPICGEPTFMVYGKYPRKDGLCKEHSQDLFNNKIQINDDGLFIDVKTNTVLNAEYDKQSKESIHLISPCVVCGSESNGKLQCRNCFNETRDFMDGLDKNSNVKKMRDYYYNLKERIFIIHNIEEAKKQCNKLIAIAMAEQNINEDTSLMDKVPKDVETLIKGKQPQPKSIYEEERKEKDEHKAKVNTAQDGHNVDSDMEVRIDDILYNACILHCYGKSIDEITEKRKKCDWYIPITSSEGVYIEYWGMKTAKYLEERKEKEELYQKHNIPYIGIEADEPKQDTQTFKSNLIRELTKIAEERFGFMPKWKR